METKVVKKVNDKAQTEENCKFNAETLAAFEEGFKLMSDPNAKRFNSIEELMADLND